MEGQRARYRQRRGQRQAYKRERELSCGGKPMTMFICEDNDVKATKKENLT